MDQDDLDDLNDPDLKAAIEASLRDTQRSDPSGESSSRVTRRNLVDLTADSDDDSDVEEVNPKSKSLVGSETEDEAEEDEDDEELKRALALSLEKNTTEDVSQAAMPSAPEEISIKSSNASAPNAPVASKSPGILGLNRKQMEEERLARLKKRKADDGSSPLPESEPKVPKTEPVPRGTAIPFPGPSLTSTPSNICQSTAANSPKFGVQPTARPVPQWPLGAVKKTHVSGIPRKGNDITIEEVFQRADLELAVLSSFMWDMEWLFSKLDTQRTRFILVMQAKEEETKLQYQQETSDMPNLRLCFPPMDGQINCMHSKLMLLFHRDYLRIVVPTANLTIFDWGENGLMENSAFLVDLPKKSDDTSSNGSKTAFYEELVYFLKAMTLNENVISKLDGFDFSKTARYAFVHTVGGSHTGGSWRRTGHCGLGRAVASLGLQSPKPINLEFVTSSVGSLTDEFLRAIYLVCQGDDGLAEYTIRNTKASAVSSHPSDPEKKITKETGKEWRDRFRVYFPSDQTVRRAHSNPAMTAGTICFQSKWWHSTKFPRHVMRDCESERGSVLMHNKIIYASPVEAIILPDETQSYGWVYIGSANLSESAWGRLVKDRATGQPKLNCRNWECGVVVPITESDLTTQEKQNMMHDRAESPGYFSPAIFRDTVPVVMKTPARQLKEGLDPWFFMG
ncbi:tyrosyl-DNA phosphodiesterase domain protein [Penicillium riverlandense]|uniref:tyrosyl-DNA phosphodiesterase domain protein n=1 Tax=Penicillium riverlandense TaxID=1903569 RepID=UPI00254954E7|nr:tyrosyl-DNA phosphodiesterase domain protein [Penicillium riverlandense]KAJ5826138.1 tyrosyl-DNA phosphodiesterase domain protein [Penicillium riverlandense]